MNLSDYLSLVAISVSLFSWYINHEQNKINLKSAYFSRLLDEFLLNKIPESLEGIRLISSCYTDENNFEDILIDLDKKVLYFKYLHNKFYIKLKKQIDIIEITLLSSEGNQQTLDEFMEAKSGLEKKVQNLYKIISDEYTGN